MIDRLLDTLDKVFTVFEVFSIDTSIPRIIRVVVMGTLFLIVCIMILVVGFAFLLALSYGIVYGFPYLAENFAEPMLILALVVVIVMVGTFMTEEE